MNAHYIKKMPKRDEELSKGGVQFVPPLSVDIISFQSQFFQSRNRVKYSLNCVIKYNPSEPSFV